MCGICGVIGGDDPQVVDRMVHRLGHRGPDARAVKVFAAGDHLPSAALGHTRLSIIDLNARGTQPMSYADNRYWVVFNGEIYNYRELRNGLEKLGHRFRTATDTEVLLAMYAEHGPAALKELEGMFAFAIWDSEAGTLFIARDRLGIKPLYWAVHDGVLVFGSEIKCMLPALPRPQLNLDALAQYLSFLWVPDPDTMFVGVRKLPPGHYGVWSRGQLSIGEWWDMSFEVDDAPPAVWSTRIQEEVFRSVESQMTADVPLGAFLSGGLDSSAVAASMRMGGREVSTYSVGYSAEDLKYDIVPDDLRYAQEVGSFLGVDGHQMTLRPEIVELLPKLVWHMDEPVADPALITTYLICQAARDELTVILSGMGADELFAGYPRHLAMKLGNPATRFAPERLRRVSDVVSEHLTVGGPSRTRTLRRNALKWLQGLGYPSGERYLRYCSYYSPDELARILSLRALERLAEQHPFAAHYSHLDRVRGHHWLNQMLYLDVKTFLPCLNLAYTDKMSMAASTEVRVPLLSEKLVEMSGRVPPEMKLHGLRRKHILKESMRGVLPDRIIDRPKAGFGAPIRAWLQNDLRPMVAELLSPEVLQARGLVDPDEVARIVRANDEGQTDYALRIWALLTLELWQRQYIDTTG